MSEHLGPFGHHPDYATDFCIHVEALEGWAYDLKVGIRNDWKHFWASLSRLLRIGGQCEAQLQSDECAPRALEIARGLERRVLQPESQHP